jgi:hypothetical protein
MGVLEKEQSVCVTVVGNSTGGKNYLLKGSNSSPGIIPSIEKRIVSLSSELKFSAKVSYIRFVNSI